jgi:hypothetical protein
LLLRRLAGGYVSLVRGAGRAGALRDLGARHCQAGRAGRVRPSFGPSDRTELRLLSTFEFVSVLMSIVVGLGITRLLAAVSSLIEHRSSIRFDFVSLAWTVNVLQYLLIYWWVVVGNCSSVQP